MQPKTDQIRAAWAAGDQIRALRIAARFFDRSADTNTFKRGMDAYNNPRFYRQLGKEPEQLTAVALQLLAKKFGLKPHNPRKTARVACRLCRGLSSALSVRATEPHASPGGTRCRARLLAPPDDQYDNPDQGDESEVAANREAGTANAIGVPLTTPVAT
jgi:hypothetical protein